MSFEKYDYVSFDIFDTIVNRNIINPTDLFVIVEKKFSKINNFKSVRIECQKKAYSISKSEEISIDDIYDVMNEFYSKDICLKLKKIEQETEINLCVPNKKNISLYNDAVKKSKVVISSDMYLDRTTIESILKKCGIKGYKKLYLSSELNRRKSTGRMFKFIKDDLNTNNILHIGNDIFSDYLIPKLNNIHSHLVKIKLNNSFINKSNKGSDYRKLQKFISNGITGDYFYDFGYECFGPILYKFVEWLTNNIKTERKFFLSRDGFLIQKAYNLFNNINEDHYFYASRRSLIIPTLWMDKDLKAMTDKLYIRDSIKIKNLFRKLGLEEESYKKIVLKYGYNIDKELKYKELFDDKIFKKIFAEVKPIIYENSKKEYKLLLDYMKQENFSGNVSIIDIGWNGNMQMAFNNIYKSINSNNTIFGYYVGILPESKNIGKLKMNGFLFDEKKNYDIYICLKVINSIFESMFLAPHGSVKKFKKNKKIEPVLYNYEYDDGVETRAYKSIQAGALKFIKDYRNSDLKLIHFFDEKDSFSNMMKFAYYPRIKDVKMFGDFKFLEDDIIYLAKPKSIIKYILHPKVLFKDIYMSGWIIGFMKRLTRINLLYPNLYKFYIKKYLEKRGREL